MIREFETDLRNPEAMPRAGLRGIGLVSSGPVARSSTRRELESVRGRSRRLRVTERAGHTDGVPRIRAPFLLTGEQEFRSGRGWLEVQTFDSVEDLYRDEAIDYLD